jgi:hypothetical protein
MIRIFILSFINIFSIMITNKNVNKNVNKIMLTNIMRKFLNKNIYNIHIPTQYNSSLTRFNIRNQITVCNKYSLNNFDSVQYGVWLQTVKSRNFISPMILKYHLYLYLYIFSSCKVVANERIQLYSNENSK